ncbi:hypothetical protein [Mesorhizobium sp. M0029]|uniref:hypothetical protein n=1 Tax=Mesorhizobium sp. M0029 TaxID=2956850 RepID=UPI00333B3797
MLSKDTDYVWAWPALLARKFRSVELRAGVPTSHARRGSAFDYNISAKRAEERSRVEKAEAAYAAAISRWRARPGKTKVVEKDGIVADRAILQHPSASACPARCSAIRSRDPSTMQGWHSR